MTHVEKNKVVQLAFTLKDAKGELLDEAPESSPLVYLHGHGALPAGLEKGLEGMKAGEKKDVHLTPAEGFGERDDKRVEKVGRHKFGAKARFKVGDTLHLDSEKGPMTATVLAMTPVTVTLDFNHPLAGKALDVSLHVINLRDGTEGEVEHGHAHGWDGKAHAHAHDDHDHDHDHGGHDHAHDHQHGPDCDHDHDHDHGAHAHDHQHGPDCDHDHSHGHKG